MIIVRLSVFQSNFINIVPIGDLTIVLINLFNNLTMIETLTSLMHLYHFSIQFSVRLNKIKWSYNITYSITSLTSFILNFYVFEILIALTK